jgi:Tol biopolymer transport system component
MKVWVCVIMAMLSAMPSEAQLRVKEFQRLAIPSKGTWSAPRFSPDGRSIFLTSPDYTGIWRFTLESKDLTQITGDRGAGFGFAVGPDGQSIAYRRSSWDDKTRRRIQEIMVVDLRTGTSVRVSAGSDLSLPIFARSSVVYSAGSSVVNLADARGTGPSVLGIDQTKIAIQVNGEKKILDPLRDGSYIWPTMSPDKSRLVAVDMGRGAFICDLQGNLEALLGRRNAPAWTRDAKWIVYMDDRDDGHRILSSDIFCVSPDGEATAQLTDTPDSIELYPDCSPVDDVIVCCTAKGEIFLIRYEGGNP